VTETEAGGAWKPKPRGTGSDLKGSSVNRRIKEDPPETDTVAGRLHAPTGDTSIHFLWNVSGIPGKQPTSTTSIARRTFPLTGDGMCCSVGKLFTPGAKTTVKSKGFHLAPEKQDELQ